jgi:hypothetical protein
MMGEYPTKSELTKITRWDFQKQDIMEFLDYLRSIWWNADWGIVCTGKQVLRLQLHSGGWSGNEDVIYALRRNFIFWSICWLKSERGGHHYFKINKKLFEGLKKGDKK